MSTVITPLGTVSPYCKKNNNCPGFMIDNEGEKILLDCGNGVTRLMNMEQDLKNLKIIISHFHRDHYADLFSIAYASYVYHRLGFLREPIDVYLPKTEKVSIKKNCTDKDGWAAIRTIKEDIIDKKLFDEFGNEHYLNFIHYGCDDEISLDTMNITFETTNHAINTYAAKINTKNGLVGYSADTGMCKRLINFFENIDLLICESSFLKGQIRTKNEHLFAHEAAQIAKLANAKTLMLTHFWPEIDKSLYQKEAQEIFANTIVAEEGKKLTLTKEGGARYE